VKRWVMSYGAQARLIEPVDLRDEIAEELSGAYLKYVHENEVR